MSACEKEAKFLSRWLYRMPRSHKHMGYSGSKKDLVSRHDTGVFVSLVI
jgi:hypothetical protein